MPTPALPAAAITMSDGRTVDFPAKRRIVKEALYGDGGAPRVRLDFRNGQTLTFTPNLPPTLSEVTLRLALHGALEVLDSAAEETEDQVEGVSNRIARLDAGEWPIRGNGDDLAGSSVLLRALVEHTGKPPETVRAYLLKRSMKEKLELRKDPLLAPIVQRLEAARRVKSTGVDTQALLAELT